MSNRLFAQYAEALVDEQSVLHIVRDNAKTTAERLNAEDAAKAWEKWKFLANSLCSQAANLDKEIARNLGDLLRETDAEEVKARELQARVDLITRQLEVRLGHDMAHIIDQFTNVIEERFSRTRKWQGDIDYLTYQSKLDDDRKLREQTDLEQQILKDNLLDLQQGALWQWPK
jgi:hypothetical protein